MLRLIRSLFGGRADGRFGTFAGVFTPSVLTILGVIMYLRLGWVVGHAGLLGALGIVVVAHCVTLITGLSISATSTTRTVGTGGAYFMLSRSLGAEVGGAIGVPLFFAQALSFSLYVMGFTEALLSVAPGLDPRWVSSGVCVMLTALSLWSASVAIKTQYLVMLAIGLSLLSFLLGPYEGGLEGVALLPGDAPSGERVPLTTVFAVFFPAVTGITAGISMSGDLRDPRRSIPRGTLAAIFVGLAVYLLLPLVLVLKASPEVLRTDYAVMQHVAWVPSLVLAGIFGATLSSAVGTVLGAPRTLQALARDGVVPRFLGRGSGPTDAPRLGTIFTFLIAEAGILLGDLNVIAPILTMFFLVTYGMLNLACFMEQWADSPGYQPELRVPAWLSALGAGACFFLMFFIHALAAAVALLAVFGIYGLLHRRSMKHSWGDARHALWAALVRSGVMGLRTARFHPRNWRPNIIVLGGVPVTRPYLAEVASWVGGTKGLVTYFYLVEGRIADLTRTRKDLDRRLRETLLVRHPQLLTRVDICSDLYEGVRNAAQSYGIAGFQANTVVMGWARGAESAPAYAELLRDLILLDKSLVLVDYDEDHQFGRHQRIDVWWGGLDNNGGLMLLLARLLRGRQEWRDAEVRLKMIVHRPGRRERTRVRLRQMLREARLRAEVEVLVPDDLNEPVSALIARSSADADLVVMGLRAPGAADGEAFVARVNELVERLPTTLLVRASAEFEGAQMIFDDQGGEDASPRSREAKPSAGLPVAAPSPDGEGDS